MLLLIGWVIPFDESMNRAMRKIKQGGRRPKADHPAV
jgi:hypothetical protein